MAEPTKQKSGIMGLDPMLGGGFVPGCAVAVAGGTGSGRTIFVSQFLVKGATEYGEPGLFLSFDQQKDSIYANLLQFGWDMAELEKQQKLVFIEYPENELSAFVEQEGALADLVETLGIKRVVIDSITPYSLLYSSEEERRLNVLRLVNAVKGWKCTCLISAETKSAVSQEAVPHTVSGVESFCDGFIHLSFLRADGRRNRAVEIIKMRASRHEHELKPAFITDKGFSICSSPEEKPVRKSRKVMIDE